MHNSPAFYTFFVNVLAVCVCVRRVVSSSATHIPTECCKSEGVFAYDTRIHVRYFPEVSVALPVRRSQRVVFPHEQIHDRALQMYVFFCALKRPDPRPGQRKKKCSRMSLESFA